MTLRGHFFFGKYHMEQFVQILLLVTVVYLTLTLAVRTMFGEHTRLLVVMTTVLVTCLVLLVHRLS